MSDGKHEVVSLEEWEIARAEILKKEKELTNARDALTIEIRAMPWTKIEKQYYFGTPHGKKSLAELFQNKSQLLVVHFMLGADWKAGCPGCSFWADSYNGLRYHLPHRDVSFKVISNAPLEEILEYKARMGWEFDWVSAYQSDFNVDFSWTSNKSPAKRFPDTPEKEGTERPGFSVFYREGNDVYQTYYSTARGLEVLNPVYGALDLVPKGRDENGLAIKWFKRHDEY